MKTFFQNAFKNWKSTLAGLATLAFTGYQVYSGQPVTAATLGQVTTGIGLIAAQDSGAIPLPNLPTATK